MQVAVSACLDRIINDLTEEIQFSTLVFMQLIYSTYFKVISMIYLSIYVF